MSIPGFLGRFTGIKDLQVIFMVGSTKIMDQCPDIVVGSAVIIDPDYYTLCCQKLQILVFVNI